MKRLTENFNEYAKRFPKQYLGDQKGYSMKSDIIYERLGAYEDLEEQEKLIILPVAVGNTVYWIDESDCEKCEEERPDINEKCTCKFGEFCGYEEIKESDFRLDMLKDFGKTVFLTREEAEATLKQKEGKSGI